MRDGVNPAGPTFISYRQSDGTDIVVELSWLMRAAGLPVWLDQTDLPPGDTEARLREAFAAGISGAVLVVTPDIVGSHVVRHVELPQLLDRELDPAFVMAVATSVQDADGKIGYKMSDQLLGQPAGTLSRLDHKAADDRKDLLKVVQALLRHRLRHAPRHEDGTLVVDIQTRSTPVADTNRGGDVVIRTRPGLSRPPAAAGLRDLADCLAFLPEAVTITGARRVLVTGGAHLSAAFALGATLPSTVVGDLSVRDIGGAQWDGPIISARSDQEHRLSQVGHGYAATTAPGRPKVLVYADLLPARSDAAYARLLEESDGVFAAWKHLRPSTASPLNSVASSALVGELAHEIRDMSGAHDNAEVHLLLRCPFAVAVLLGRLTNTLRVVIYEWDDDDRPGDPDYRARFVPALRLRATAALSPVEEVLLT